MRVISLINLKGGVYKTTTALSLAHILAAKYNKRVLMIDNDKQGNLSKTLQVYDPDDEYTMAEIMDMRYSGALVHQTFEKGISVIPANMNLLTANTRAVLDYSRKQQDRLQKALEFLQVGRVFDYVVIDNAPDINISIINALAVSDDVVIPMHMDEYSLDGMEILMDQIKTIRDNFNDHMGLVKCLVTDYSNDEVNRQAMELVQDAGYEMFRQTIRHTARKPMESVWARMPLVAYSPRCGASVDYRRWVEEYLGGEL